jgi:hypothetical protein
MSSFTDLEAVGCDSHHASQSVGHYKYPASLCWPSQKRAFYKTFCRLRVSQELGIAG